jgi:aconitase A
VREGTVYVIEYFCEGIENLLCTDTAIICNIGAKISAIISVLLYTGNLSEYLRVTERYHIAEINL